MDQEHERRVSAELQQQGRRYLRQQDMHSSSGDCEEKHGDVWLELRRRAYLSLCLLVSGCLLSVTRGASANIETQTYSMSYRQWSSKSKSSDMVCSLLGKIVARQTIRIKLR